MTTIDEGRSHAAMQSMGRDVGRIASALERIADAQEIHAASEIAARAGSKDKEFVATGKALWTNALENFARREARRNGRRIRRDGTP